jgi:hypothetical protein
MQTRPDFEKRRQRVDAYTDARIHVQQLFPGVTSKRQVRSVTKSFLTTLFAPSAGSILRKALQMEERLRLSKEHQGLRRLLQCSADAAALETLLAQIDAKEGEIRLANSDLAFRHRSKSEEQRVRFKLAAQYSDLWAELLDEFGHLIGGFVSFYVCMGGGSEHPCATLIASKVWDRLHEDPLQSGQR